MKLFIGIVCKQLLKYQHRRCQSIIMAKLNPITSIYSIKGQTLKYKLDKSQNLKIETVCNTWVVGGSNVSKIRLKWLSLKQIEGNGKIKNRIVFFFSEPVSVNGDTIYLNLILGQMMSLKNYIIWLSRWRRHYPNPKLPCDTCKIFLYTNKLNSNNTLDLYTYILSNIKEKNINWKDHL